MSPRIPSDAASDGSFVVPIQPVTSTREQEFERIYRAHYRDVYRYVLAFTRSAEEAEEISADTFERALRTWQETPDPALPWLLLTARRKATDRWRRARRWARIALTLHPAERGDAGERRTEFWLWFGAVSRLLTDRQREVLVLRYQRDLTDADVGRIMGLSQSGVRSLAARALDVLRAHPEVL
jgi:RNA polymerase sigma-70 factor (ECF subfamily)